MTDKEVIQVLAKALTQYMQEHPCKGCLSAGAEAREALDRALMHSMIGPGPVKQ